jgi:hypothetical protein
MTRTPYRIAILALAAQLAPALAAAQGDPADAGIGAEAEAADAGASGPELAEPFVPVTNAEPSPPPFDDGASAAPPADLPDGKPFAKGDMEPGLGLSFAGYDSSYYMMIGASFAYYVVNRFAPGLEVSYGTDFGSADMPDSVTLLPFAKFVILRSSKFAPYLIALAGREFEFQGYNAIHSWIVGGGVGAHVGLGEHFSLKIEVTFQHHWYDDPRIRGYDDDRLYKDETGNKYPCPSGVACGDLAGWTTAEATDGTACLVDPANPDVYTCAERDKKDLTHEWIFPIISLGMAFSF